MSEKVVVLGGGLAGSEAVLYLASKGHKVVLYEMRPKVPTEAHRTEKLAELVCSNSLGSDDPSSSSKLLKTELLLMGSKLIEIAYTCKVRAGRALAVDRNEFASKVTQLIENNRNIEVIREEYSDIPENYAIIASGPLTSSAMSRSLQKFVGMDFLFFYDAISPIVYGDSLILEDGFFASRYQKDGDYFNCPMDKSTYDFFIDELLKADPYPKRSFEDDKVFEACMPIEVLAKRGRDALRFGPFKPVGLKDPSTGRRPYAVIQLRREDKFSLLWNLVGCQTRLKYSDQKRIFRIVPALKNARFARFGGIHRNTYLFSPGLLNRDLSFKKSDRTFLAGQLTGAEGYCSAIATGLLAACNLDRKIKGLPAFEPPEGTALRALLDFLTDNDVDADRFQPMSLNFGMIKGYSPVGHGNKREYRKAFCERAAALLKKSMSEQGVSTA